MPNVCNHNTFMLSLRPATMQSLQYLKKCGCIHAGCAVGVHSNIGSNCGPTPRGISHVTHCIVGKSFGTLAACTCIALVFALALALAFVGCLCSYTCVCTCVCIACVRMSACCCHCVCTYAVLVSTIALLLHLHWCCHDCLL